MKRSNKNNISLSLPISSCHNLVDRDECVVHGEVRHRKSDGLRYRFRSIDYIYGVNKKLSKVNSEISSVEIYSLGCHGHDHDVY
jgi:hypothetical protein